MADAGVYANAAGELACRVQHTEGEVEPSLGTPIIQVTPQIPDRLRPKVAAFLIDYSGGAAGVACAVGGIQRRFKEWLRRYPGYSFDAVGCHSFWNAVAEPSSRLHSGICFGKALATER